MSSSERQPSSTRRRAPFGVAVAAMMLAMVAGCTVHPVYMPVAGNRYTAADLSSVTVGPVSGRVPQEVRNALLLGLTGGKPAPTPKYMLNIEVSNSEERLGFVKDETAPSYQVNVKVAFEVRSIADDRVLLRSVSIGNASYDRSNQNFANERARIDAENRAADAVADEIRLRLALAVAKDAPPAQVAIPKRPDLPEGGTPSIISNTM